MRLFKVCVDVLRSTTYEIVIQAENAGDAENIAAGFTDYDKEWKEIDQSVRDVSDAVTVEGKFVPLGRDE